MSNLTVVKYENLIEVGSHFIGNVINYDHYISATVNSQDSFTFELLNTFNFNINAYVAFFGLNDEIPNNLSTNVFKKNLSNVRSENTVNLDFYTSNFNNIFLRVDVNGEEIAWLNYVNEEKLNRIKQLVITLNPSINDIGLQKLANTHYPVHVASKDEKLVITYLRKDLVVIEEPSVVHEPVVHEPEVIVVVDEVVVGEPVKISEESVQISEESVVIKQPVVEEETVAAVLDDSTSEDSSEEPTVVSEEPPVVSEEPVVKEQKKKGRPRKQK
jgi:hypothetical protein